MKRIVMFFVAATLAVVMTPTAHAVTWKTYWSMVGGACTPLDTAIQNNRYIVASGALKHASTNVDLVIAYCPITPNDAGVGNAFNPDRLFMAYQDSTSNGTPNTYVSAAFTRLTRSTGSTTAIVTITSESFATAAYTEQNASFTHTMDFETNAYYIRAEVDRAMTSETANFVAVALQKS